MSVNSVVREVLKALREVALAFCVRVILWPYSLVTSRNTRLYVVIGREDGRFLDNAKYFFSWLSSNTSCECKVVFLTENADLVSSLGQIGAAALRYPSFSSLRILLRAGTVVLDSAEGTRSGRIGLLRGARLVQLWHGVPLKEIELPLHRRRLASLGPIMRVLVMLHKWVIGRYPRYDIVISTSQFTTEEAFSRCFKSQRFIAAGYPRNDILTNAAGYAPALVALNTDTATRKRLRKHREDGGKVVLYAPTFRRDRGSSFLDDFTYLAELSALALSCKLIIALKLHPVMRGQSYASEYPQIINIAPESDIYPLLPEVDVMVTDYSSIFFDFLLLDRRIIFYAPDYENYMHADQSFLLDYHAMTPGPKVSTFRQLLQVLQDSVTSNDDPWQVERVCLREEIFDYEDGLASKRIFSALFEEVVSNP